MNSCVSPFGTWGFVGVTAMDTSAGAATVRDEEPHREPAHAVTLVVPCAVETAVPAFVESFVIAAIAWLEELHVTDCTTSVLESLNVPVATKCWLVAAGMEALLGVTAMETRLGMLSEGGT